MTLTSSSSARRCLRITETARAAAQLGERQVPVALDGEQAVALHPGDGLAHGRAALLQPLGDPGAQRRHPLLFQLEDGAQVHLGGVDQVMLHVRRSSRWSMLPRTADRRAAGADPDGAAGPDGVDWPHVRHR